MNKRGSKLRNIYGSRAKPVTANSDVGELGDRQLSLSETYEVAQSRGDARAVSSLNRDLAVGKLEPFRVEIVEKSERHIENRV